MSFLIRNFKEYQDQYKKSLEDPEGFWAGIAENFLWKKPWTEVLKWNFSDPDVQSSLTDQKFFSSKYLLK